MRGRLPRWRGHQSRPGTDTTHAPSDGGGLHVAVTLA